MHSTKISGLAVDTEYTFYLLLRTSAGTRTSEKVAVRTHKMTDLSGITITTGILPAATRDRLAQAVERIGAKTVDGVRIDTTHFVTTEGRGPAWEKAVENNIPVVRPEWVEACEHNGRILGVTRFYLDAMRAGPLPEEPPAPPVPPKAEVKEEAKEEARPETPGDDDEKPGGGYEKAASADGKSDKTGDDESGDDQETEPEQKTKNSLPDEQKMRLEEKEKHKVALRPRGQEAPANGWIKDEKDDDDKAREDQGTEKPVANTDGSSFQEVEL